MAAVRNRIISPEEDVESESAPEPEPMDVEEEVDDDDDDEEEVDDAAVEPEDEEVQIEVQEEEESDEEEGERGDVNIDLEDVASELDELSSPAPTPPAASGLKITLKRPAQPKASSSRDIDIESEDEDEDDDEAPSTRSVSAMPGSSTRPMTARQAVLASVVDSSHVSLHETTSKKKKQLNEAELALRREETARKRKHLSEKKLEDEKAETINRLLKKQTRPRNKRNALASAEDRTPATGTGTPVEGDAADVEPAGTTAEASETASVPTLYRWVSSTKGGQEGEERRMVISFAVPVALLPAQQQQQRGGDEEKMQVDEETPQARAAPACDVEGCGERRKYRLVRDWTRGACGMGHLKVLEQRSESTAT